MKLLEGKTALVTGGSRGIGKATALRFASEGADVAITYMSREQAALEVVAEIESMGRKAVCIRSDASDTEAAAAVVARVVEWSGRLDILVNNAGIRKDALILRMSESQWDDVIGANLKSAFNYCKAAAPVMLSQRSGSIINMSSVVGLMGNPGQCNYSASKAGLVGLTMSLAKELGSKGIRVNCIAPGFIASEMTETMPEDVKASWLKEISLRREGSPEEVASVALFLASDMSSYVTGETINCSGNIKG